MNRHFLPPTITSIALAFAVLTGSGTVAGIALGFVPAALAQDAPGGPPPGAPPSAGGHQRRGQILMSLNLSDGQKAQVRSIIAAARAQNKNVTDRDQRRANMKAAFEKIDTVLTPAQRTQFHTKLAAARAQEPAHAQ